MSGSLVSAGSGVGPSGDPAPTAPVGLSTDPGNLVTLGSDSKIYLPATNLLVPTNEYYDQDDFVSFSPYAANVGSSKLFRGDNSGGAGALVVTYATTIYPGHPGVLQLAPGSTASSWARLYMPGVIYTDNNITLTIQGVMGIPSGSFASGNNQFSFGLSSSPGTTTAATGFHAMFIAAPSSPNWTVYTHNGTTNTHQTDVGIPASDARAVSWHKFKIIYTGIGLGAGTGQVQYFIDDNLVGTVTDNSVPISQILYIHFGSNNGTGTNNYSLFVDAFDIWMQLVAQSGESATRFMRRIL